MKVILQQTVDGVGHLGDLLDVSDGYARNFLLPRRKALEANTRNLKALEHVKRVTAEKAKKERLEFEEQAKKVSTVSLTITAKVGKDNKMFGSVTSKDVAEGLAEQGHTIDRRRIGLDHPIKELGTFRVPVKLYKDVTASVTVHVVKKEKEKDKEKEAAVEESETAES